MSTHKPSQSEEEFIVRQEALVRHKAAVEKARKMAAAERDERRRLHWMKCPKCGFDLESVVYRGVTIDKCYHCHGTWLDEGELERLAGHGGDALSKIAEIFHGRLTE
jgi:hypothetical protein